MIAIYLKELSSFFSSLIGYVAIAVFLVLMGLIFWVFPGNVLDYGYAGLDLLFDHAPVVFMLLIPAITMRLFAEEKRAGTLEIISTRPVTEFQIVFGKYFAAFTLVLMALLPTLLYYFTVAQLASPAGNLDHGAIRGSYLGLVLLSAVFASIGLFASSLTENQIIAFLLAAFLSFIFFSGFAALGALGWLGGKGNDVLQQAGIQYHYASISRGIVDSRDVVYFFSLIVIFLLATKTILESRKW